MADEKVRQVEHDFSGRPLRPFGELSLEGGEPFVDTTLWPTRDGRWANQAGDGTFYLVDDDGNQLPDQPIDEDEVIR